MGSELSVTGSFLRSPGRPARQQRQKPAGASRSEALPQASSQLLYSNERDVSSPARIRNEKTSVRQRSALPAQMIHERQRGFDRRIHMPRIAEAVIRPFHWDQIDEILI